MIEVLLQYCDIIDEEIIAYEKLGELYAEKEQVLIHGNGESLYVVDEKIVNQAEVIDRVNVKRIDFCKNSLDDENITLSDIIEKTKTENPQLSEKFEQQQKRIRDLSKELSKLEKSHQELIKHGMAIVDKTMKIILDVVSPQSQQYDKSGHNVKCDESMISSISEEV